MHIPAARERVEIAGKPGVFLVLNIDREAKCVDVLALNDNPYLEENIPFSLSLMQPETHGGQSGSDWAESRKPRSGERTQPALDLTVSWRNRQDTKDQRSRNRASRY